MSSLKINRVRANYLYAIAKKIYLVDPRSTVRNRFNVFARCAISIQLRKDGECFEGIGNFLNKNHASIMHGVKLHDDRMIYDKEYQELYNSFLLEIDESVNLEKAISDELKFKASGITKELISEGLDAIEIMNFWEDCYDTEMNKINQ